MTLLQKLILYSVVYLMAPCFSVFVRTKCLDFTKALSLPPLTDFSTRTMVAKIHGNCSILMQSAMPN